MGSATNTNGTVADCAAQGLTDCNVGYCVDLLTDPYNCGACGTTCALTGNCQGGVCPERYCQFGLTHCGGYCVDTLTDPANCGACSNACAPGGSCEGGVCASLRLRGRTDRLRRLLRRSPERRSQLRRLPHLLRLGHLHAGAVVLRSATAVAACAPATASAAAATAAWTRSLVPASASSQCQQPRHATSDGNRGACDLGE